MAAAEALKALIVDDESMTRMIHRMIVAGFGFQVTEAGDGQSAINHFLHGNEADLILMDRQMPVMDGVQATRTLRTMGVKAKIVAVTADADYAGDFLEAGADAFLIKPVSRAELATVLKKFNLLM